ncbi:MAG: hypothetical protein O8C62_01790 [Candidatus Methanoperedens sp.]|nr:hypothetical protein [Candidatus Methanoperedens sp.]
MSTKRRFVLIILLMTGLIASAQAAKVYGTIYEWSDIEKPLKNVIVEVNENSTRIQYNISTTGAYAFDIPTGKYSIKARYYRNNILEYTGEEKLEIDNPDESRNIDLLLFPPTESEYEYLGDINLTGDLELKSESNQIYYIITTILVFAALLILYWMRKKKNKPIEQGAGETIGIPPENIAKTESTELPEDLRGIYELILKKGGRVTQKELRKEVKYGEAKVSLMIADLENRGLVKKIKKGRANIIIAEAKK